MTYLVGGAGGALTDGDKGSITVSAAGATWTLDDSVVTTAKMGGDVTTAGKALLDDANAAAQRTTLGLGTIATTAQFVLNVKDYGAVGDGTTDDTTAVQAALTAATAYQTVVLSGSHMISALLTMPTSNVRLKGPGKILAKAATNFEYMLTATSLTGIGIEDVEFDANQANRSSGQNVRFMGAGLLSCTDSYFLRCTARNTRGYSGISAVGLVIGAGTRCRVISPTLRDCGVAGNDSDGVYCSGDQIIIAGGTAINGTDTAYVLENCNLSMIVGCSADGFAAGAAITNATIDDKIGNVIDGLTVNNWDASTGGIQIGMPGVTGGDLSDTIVANVTMTTNVTGGYGDGPAIRVVHGGGAGNILGVSIVAPRITGGDTQGILVVDGDNVHIADAIISGTTDACIQFQAGSNHEVSNSRLSGGSFGVVTQGTATATLKGVTLRGQSDTGIYAYDTSTITIVGPPLVSSPGVKHLGKDSGATITIAPSVQSFAGGTVTEASYEEELTLSTSGTTTDSTANLLPANSVILGVTARITTTIATATDWSLGDATTAARFASANSTLTAGTTAIGANHLKGGVATDAAGPTQTAAAKLRITCTGTPSAGKIRVTVFARTFSAATS